MTSQSSQLRCGGPGHYALTLKTQPPAAQDPRQDSEECTQQPVLATPLLLESSPWGLAWTLSPEARASDFINKIRLVKMT